MSLELPLAFSSAEDASGLSEAARYLHGLLAEAAPGAEIVGIARRPGVLSKVAVRHGLIPGEVITRLREPLDGENVQVVQWQAQPRTYIAAALGLQEVPPMVLKPAIRHAHVLLGEIDLRGMSGWRGINRLLASTLTGWRIHLEPIAETPAWRSLRLAQAQRRAVDASVMGASERGAILEVQGLHAILPGNAQTQELQVRITRMDPDEGRIWVSDKLAETGQLRLPSN